jgi:hypothetical protein
LFISIYQLLIPPFSFPSGNLVSSASSTIESTIGEQFPLPPLANGTKRYKYGLVICIFMGCVYAYTMLATFVGPEYLGRRMDADSDEDFNEATGGAASRREHGIENLKDTENRRSWSGEGQREQIIQEKV